MNKLLNRSNSNFAVVDGIRAIAVLWVIFFHAWLFQQLTIPGFIDNIYNYPLFYWVTKGDLGVDLFFVISGFLIGGIIFKEIKSSEKFNFKRFYVRRFLRLSPVYIFAIFLNLLTRCMSVRFLWGCLGYSMPINSLAVSLTVALLA